jgi:hypothetical protein
MEGKKALNERYTIMCVVYPFMRKFISIIIELIMLKMGFIVITLGNYTKTKTAIVISNYWPTDKSMSTSVGTWFNFYFLSISILLTASFLRKIFKQRDRIVILCVEAVLKQENKN